MSRWLNLLEISILDASQEKEYLDFYESIHLPDILTTPGYLSGKIFRAKEFREGRGQLLTMYDIETEDIDQTIALRRQKRLEERARGRSRDTFVVIWRDVVWKPLSERCVPTGSEVNQEKWVNLWEMHCADPLREKEFNDWLDNSYLQNVLASPGFLAARRYERKEFVGGRGKYLIVYDVQTGDVDKTIALRQARWKGKGESYSDLFMWVWRDVWWKLVTERHAR